MGTKTWIILLALGVLMLGLLRSERFNAVADKSSAIELSYWNGFTGPDGRVMLGIVREFNEANPDAHVTMQRMEWGTYYNKILVANADGRGPEVFVVTASYLPRMVRAGFVSDVDEVYDISQGGPPLADFNQIILDQLIYDGHYKGLALDVHPQGLYCNADMLKEVGCVDEQGNPRAPKDAAEFIEVAKKMRKGTSIQDAQWGFSMTIFQNNFLSVLPQFGARLLDEEGKPTIDSPESIAALEALTALVLKDKIAPSPENNLGWTGFRQKRIGMVWDGIYMLGDLKRLENFRYVAAPTIQLGPKPGVHGDSHIVCIRKGIDPKKRDAALRFLRFLSMRSLEWADAGQVPARKSFRETDRFKAMHAQYEFSKQLSYVRYPPRTQIQLELLMEVNTAVERALRGRVSPAEALKDAQENVVRFVEREKRERGAEAIR